MGRYHYKTKGTCARSIEVELDGKIIRHVSFEGGCNGNLKGISKLVEGMDMDLVIERFKGNTCNVSPHRLLINDGHEFSPHSIPSRPITPYPFWG